MPTSIKKRHHPRENVRSGGSLLITRYRCAADDGDSIRRRHRGLTENMKIIDYCTWRKIHDHKVLPGRWRNLSFRRICSLGSDTRCTFIICHGFSALFSHPPLLHWKRIFVYARFLPRVRFRSFINSWMPKIRTSWPQLLIFGRLLYIWGQPICRDRCQ